MADNSIPQYPMMFDPSQWANKYSNYAGKALPWPSQYSGTPTDALGRPIQSYLDAQNAAAAQPAAMPPSTSLNSNPLTQVMSPNGFVPGGVPGGLPTPGMPASYNPGAWGNQSPIGLPQPQPQQQAAPPAAGPAGPDMSQAYLNALSNPGKVVTPGATVPQSAPPSGQSNVLQQFLQNWKPSNSPAAGNYNPNLFISGLRGNI